MRFDKDGNRVDLSRAVMSRLVMSRLVVSRLAWALAVLPAGPVLAQTVDPMRTPFGGASAPTHSRGAVARPVASPPAPPAAVPPPATVRPPDSTHQNSTGHDNGRSRSPFLRSLDRDTPNLTPRPDETGADAFLAQPDTYGPRPNRPMPQRHRRPGGVGGSGIWRGSGVLPYYAWPAGSVVGVTAAPPPSPPSTPPEGYLRLRVSPRSSEVFVDGAYAGTADEFGGTSDRLVPAGLRRIELRAPGFEPMAFDARVPANDTLTYRRDLTPIDDPAAAPAAPAAPLPVPAHKTIYIVPGCYAGDTPPQASQLPARCHLADLRIIQ